MVTPINTNIDATNVVNLDTGLTYVERGSSQQQQIHLHRQYKK